MTKPIFITGIGTGVGKTIVSAMLTASLNADYWKPIQAGYEKGTDSQLIKQLLEGSTTTIFNETYKLQLAVSPHIAAAHENIRIDINKIVEDFTNIQKSSKADCLIIEGAGGLMVPLNEDEFIADLIKKLDALVIIVSRNYLGSINHSLLTSMACRQHNLNVLGWIFNDQYLNYQNEIVQWSGYPNLYAVPALQQISPAEVLHHAQLMKQNILARIKLH